MLTIDKFEEASEVVKRVTQDTKLIFSDYFSQMTGNKVYFKPENMQRTGAYKLRGAYSCAGCGLCGKSIRCKGCHRYADHNTTDQSRENKKLRCGSCPVWRCLR